MSTVHVAGVRHPVAGSTSDGRIGPNAITQTVAALRALYGDTLTTLVLRKALGRTLDSLPDDMVDEHEANALMAEVRDEVGEIHATAIHREAGTRTADYLLAHRIPRPAQVVIRALAPSLGLRVLLRAIRAHAWTFTGRGAFTYAIGDPTMLCIAECPLCRDQLTRWTACVYYAATFERLLRMLVDERLRVAEVECMAVGGSACRFVVERA